MVRVDAAPRAEVVLRHAGIEPVNGQRLFAGVERDTADIGRYRDRAAHPAVRTDTAASGVESVGQFHSEAHGTAVACRPHLVIFIRLHRQVPELCRRFLLTHALREKRLFDHAARRFDRLLDSILSNGSPWTSRTSIGPPGTASSKTPMASRPVYHANVSRLVRFFLKIGPCAC